MTLDLAPALIERLERLATASTTVMRAEVHEVLGLAGVDVARLAADVRDRMRAEAQDRLDAVAAKSRLVQTRVASGRLSPAQASKAADQLARLDVRQKAAEKEARRILRRLEARPMPAPSAPTPERLRHEPEAPVIRDREPGGQPLSAPRYELAWPIDRLGVTLSADEYAAASRLRNARQLSQAHARVVDLNGAGGGVPGPRTPTTDRAIFAGQDWRAVWLRLPPELRAIAQNFILEEAPRGRDKPLSAVEFGQVYGGGRDKATARGVTVGAVKTTCAVIAGLYRDYDQWRSEKRRAGQRCAS